MVDIAVEGGDIVPRSIGETIHPPTTTWPSSRSLANIPSAVYTGETPIHRAQRVLTNLPYPIFLDRATPIKDMLVGILRRR